MCDLARILPKSLLAFVCALSSIQAAPPPVLPWLNYAEPRFPAWLMSTTIRDGFVVVVFTFDNDGRITDRVALSASHPAFSIAVFEAMREWQIDVGKLGSDIRREQIRYDFHRGGFFVSMTQREATKAAFNPYGDEIATAIRTMPEADLNPRPEVLAKVAPEYPEHLRAEGVSGTASVTFVIDAEGRVRVPAISQATHPAFGDAAVLAVSQWIFAVPKVDDMPVQVSASRTFRFGLKPAED